MFQPSQGALPVRPGAGSANRLPPSLPARLTDLAVAVPQAAKKACNSV